MSQSNLSEMLSGRREFSKSAIAKICHHFKISTDLFF
jgi:antitoxin component HigA of HigAB toxin-antitoxin module